MKLSNKILIGLFAFIFLYLIAAFSEIRFRGHLNRLDESTGIVETVDITGVTYLIFQDLNNSVTVVGSEESRIEARSISGDLLKNLEYEMRGDTLELVRLELAKDEIMNLTVYLPSSIKAMAVYDGKVIIRGLDQKHLTISQIGGRIRIADDNNFKKLQVHVENGNLNFSGAKLDTLSVQLNNSNANIESGAVRVEGTLANDSYLWMREVDAIDIEKDKTSRLSLN